MSESASILDASAISRHAWTYATIQRHRKALEKEARGWRKLLLAYWSRWAEDEAGGSSPGLDDEDPDSHPMLVGVNYLFAFVDSLVAAVAPMNPQSTVKSRRTRLKTNADFRQALINEVWKMENVSAKGRRLTGRTALFGRCYMKQVWNSKRKIPKYRVVRPHKVYHDDNAEEWADLKYIGEIVPLTRGEFEQRLVRPGKRGGKYRLSTEDLQRITYCEYPKWLTDDGLDEGGEVHRENYQWVVVYEHYDLVARKFYHFVEGIETPIYESALPYALMDNPFSLLTFNDNMIDLRGLSDGALIYPTLDRLNEISTLELWHIKAAIPIPVIHEGLLDDPEEFENQLRKVSGPGDVIRLSAPGNVDIQNVLGSTPVVQLPVEWQAVRMALITAIELVTGMPGFMRGAGAPGDVATSTALSAEAHHDRANVRQKALYELLAENGKKTCNLFAEYMETEDSIPLRLNEDAEEGYQEVTRATLGFGPVRKQLQEDSPWDFEYGVHPYSAAEENDLVMLKRAMEATPNVISSTAVNQQRWFTWILGLLGAPRTVLNTPEELQAAQAAMAPPAPMGATPEEADLTALDAMNPVAANVQGGQPSVTGAQNLSTGFESSTPL